MQKAPSSPRRPWRSLALATALLTLLPSCRSVTGYLTLPVYSGNEEALDRVTVHFTADCVTAGEQEPLVRITYVDTRENVRFDGDVFAPLCAEYDSVYGVYGRFHGFYYPAADLRALGRYETGAFVVEIIDGGRPGYSVGDYFCLEMQGGTFARYKLPTRHNFDDDVLADENCAYIGGGKIQLNLDSTEKIY